MPTSTRVFAEVAAKFGSVDPSDADAVRRWYEETVPTLPRKQINEILDELLHHDGSVTKGAPTEHYPANVSLPSLDDSPPAPLPFFFVGGFALLRRTLERFTGGSEES